jgi:hypothetical protein
VAFFVKTVNPEACIYLDERPKLAKAFPNAPRQICIPTGSALTRMPTSRRRRWAKMAMLFSQATTAAAVELGLTAAIASTSTLTTPCAPQTATIFAAHVPCLSSLPTPRHGPYLSAPTSTAPARSSYAASTTDFRSSIHASCCKALLLPHALTTMRTRSWLMRQKTTFCLRLTFRCLSQADSCSRQVASLCAAVMKTMTRATTACAPTPLLEVVTKSQLF